MADEQKRTGKEFNEVVRIKGKLLTAITAEYEIGWVFFSCDFFHCFFLFVLVGRGSEA